MREITGKAVNAVVLPSNAANFSFPNKERLANADLGKYSEMSVPARLAVIYAALAATSSVNIARNCSLGTVSSNSSNIVSNSAECLLACSCAIEYDIETIVCSSESDFTLCPRRIISLTTLRFSGASCHMYASGSFDLPFVRGSVSSTAYT